MIAQDRIAQLVQTQKVFSGYGLTLIPVVKEDLDRICCWRNNKAIVPLMDNNFKTNKLSLSLWYNRIKKDYTCLPYIISRNKEAVGYVEFKNFNLQEYSCEQGVFLDTTFQSQGIGKKLNLLQEKILKEINIIYIYFYIRKINVRNIHIWKTLGAEIVSEDENSIYMKSDKDKRYQELSNVAKRIGMLEEWNEFLNIRAVQS